MKRNILKIFALIMVTTSCRTLPKITPFVEASSEMRKGVNTGFLAIDKSLDVSELSSSVSTDNELSDASTQALTSLGRNKEDLKQLLKSLDKAMLGIAAYAGSLNSLVESGNSGEKNALQATKALTDVLNQLTPQPVGKIVGLTQEGIAKINGQITIVRAANSLSKIMEEASPVLDEYNIILSKMMDEMLRYNKSVFQIKRQLLFQPMSLNQNIIDYDKELTLAYVTPYSELAIITEYRNSSVPTKVNILKKLKVVPEEKDVELRELALITQIKKNELERMRISPMVEKIKSIQKRYTDEYTVIDDIFNKSKDAINAWTATHADIKEQLDKKSQPDFVKLLAIVEDLKVIREKLKTLNP